MMSSSGINRFPFTASQWQELEHQALIFKYMVSGMPVPPDLLFTIQRSSLESPPSSSTHPYPHQHQNRWNCFQMGLGVKGDPEPGRCRRTDGKKWRCSKDAYPDSRYCERHMHRGKNRSRKPVEVMTPSTQTTTTTRNPLESRNNLSSSKLINLSSSSTSYSLSPLSPITNETHHHQNLYGYHHSRFNNTHLQNHFLHPHSYTSRPPGNGIELFPRDNNTHLLLDSGSCCHTDPDNYRYIHGGLNEHAFHSEDSRTTRSFSSSSIDDPLQLTPLTMSSSEQSGGANASKQQQKHHQDQDYYLLGTDLKCQTPSKIDRNEQKTGIHDFFGEWAPKSRDSWLNTQLSISIPNSSHDFPIFNSRTHNDGLSYQ